ncbi:hypothetical protein [Kribbella sindirgiensis]|uniref:Uncharacterized protein n=1 Tax=Kribbella sindirgiensis TaxID=1124744 RepID=A0A4R0ITY0_9ACTN|nr:hypothetical protein [Kribbella sindirgiensis]TCC34976.1 hypothetical protein E0H50_13900 [Kribbella sindirgiensis]
MADANVDKLVQKVNQLVVLDSIDGVSSLRRGQTLDLSDGHVEMLRPLADNLDLPGRLASSLHSISDTRGRWHDRREDARAGLTELVALCADSLEPDSSLPEPADAAARDRLATAVCRAYAANATPRLVAGLFPNGRPDDLGRFPLPQLEGDVAAARAMAVAIGARTASGEDAVLKRLVAAGHGGAAYEAAGMLLEARMDYARLPQGQRAGIRRQLATSIEAGFAERDLERAAARELTEELENRREDVTGGAGAIDTASGIATEEVGKLHEFLQKIDYWEKPADQPLPGLPAERPQSLEDLFQRVHGTVGELTGAQESSWNGEQAPWPDMTGRATQSLDGMLHLTRDARLELHELTRHGSSQLTPEQVSGARGALRDLTAEYALMAGHARQEGLAASLTEREFTPAERAVAAEFAAQNLNDVAVRTLPPELAAQVVMPEPAYPDTQHGQVVRGFANAVDNLKGLETRPSESLRRMAGSADFGTTAGELLVVDSELPESAQPAAVQAIAATVDRGLTDVPSTATANEALMHGQELGRKAYAHTLAPDSPARFAVDAALTRPQTAAPTSAPTTTAKTTQPNPTQTRDR